MEDDSDSDRKVLEDWSLTKGKRVYIPDDSPRSRMIFKNRKAQLKLEEFYAKSHDDSPRSRMIFKNRKAQLKLEEFYAKSHKERMKDDRNNPTISP